MGELAERRAPSVSVVVTAICASAAGILALCTWALLLAGTYRWWHPLPFWDQWDGMLGWWFKISQGDVAGWISQHNEHRIVLTRIFFWIDLTLTHGAGWSLIVVNLVLMALIAVTLVSLVLARFDELPESPVRRWAMLLASAGVIALAGSWMQVENVIWGFQSQFFLAALLPLLGFVCLARSASTLQHSDRVSRLWFVCACVFLALAPWSLAAGLLGLPLSLLTGFALRLGRSRLTSLAVLSLGAIAIYLVGYRTPLQSANPVVSIVAEPQALLGYVVTYLGGPIEVLTGERLQGWAVGLTVLLVAIIGAFLLLSRRVESPAAASAWTFLIYLVGAASLTASGRLNAGIDQALASRYMTLVLIGYACCIILVVPVLYRRARVSAIPLSLALLLVPMACVLPVRVAALNFTGDSPLSSPDEVHWDRERAALALALGVPDKDVVSAVWPWDPSIPADLAQRSIRDGLTYIGTPSYQQALNAARLGLSPTQIPVACQGWVDSRNLIEGSDRVRLDGWVYPAGVSEPGDFATVYGSAGFPVGVTRLGGPRADISVAVEGAPATTGFIGYVAPTLMDEPVWIGGQTWRCTTPLNG